MSTPTTDEADQLVRSCVDSVRAKIVTAFESAGRRDVDVAVTRSIVESYCVPAHIKVVFKPVVTRCTEPGSCIPSGALEVADQQDAETFIADHMVASPEDYHATRRHLQKNFKLDGLAVGSRNMSLPEDCVQHRVAYVMQCAHCGGRTRVNCSRCNGQQVVPCWTCHGSGSVTVRKQVGKQGIGLKGTGTAAVGISGDRNRRSGIAVFGDVDEPCGTCGGRQQVQCPGCRGTGVLACEPCAGTGCITDCHSLKYELTTTIVWPSNETPETLQAWILDKDLSTLVQEQAISALLSDKRVPQSGSLMQYDIMVPFGAVWLKLDGKAEEDKFVVAGKTGEIVEGAAFLESTLPPFKMALREGRVHSSAEALLVLADALRDPVVRIVSTQALARPDSEYHEVFEEVVATLPAGLSNDRMRDIADAARYYADLAFDRRRVCVRIARYALLSLVLFSVYFFLAVRVAINDFAHPILAHLADVGVVVLVLIRISRHAVRITQSEVAKTFAPLLPGWREQPGRLEVLSKRFSLLSGMRAVINAEVILLFVLMAAFAMAVVGKGPVWIAWLFNG